MLAQLAALFATSLGASGRRESGPTQPCPLGQVLVGLFLLHCC